MKGLIYIFSILLLTATSQAENQMYMFDKGIEYGQFELKVKGCHDRLGRFNIPLSIIHRDNGKENHQFHIVSNSPLLLAKFCKIALLDQLARLLDQHKILYSSADSLDEGGYMYIKTEIKEDQLAAAFSRFDSLERLRQFDGFKLNALYFFILAMFILFLGTRIYFIEDKDA